MSNEVNVLLELRESLFNDVARELSNEGICKLSELISTELELEELSNQ